MSAAPAASPPRRTLTREDIVRLGRAGRAWEFLPVALQAVRQLPHDAELRLLLAANAAGLGLASLAREQLDALGEDGGRQAARLASDLEALPDDRIPHDDRLATLAANLDALASRGVDLRGHLARWSEADRERVWLRAGDANVLRRRADAFENLGDHLGAARRFVGTHLTPGSGAASKPLTIEGLDPPWLALAAAGATPAGSDGFRPRLRLVQADPMELLDGLAHTDMASLLGEDRVSVFVGPDAGARLAQDLRDRFDTQVIGPVIPLASVRTRAAPGVQQVVARAEADQRAEHQRLRETVATRYAGRDRAWWRERFAAALDGDAPALRVLVPTCRYSTYIQHASRALVESLRGTGLEADLLIEPDDHSRFSSLAYLRAIERMEPDLVVLINYTRAHLGDLFPPELPFVCWMQDAMTHHYDASIGAAQTPMDFLVGHLPPELFEQFGYPRERTMEMPVVTSARTFHPGPVDGATARRFECEIAWVSHHSEDPADMHARLREEVGPEMAPLLDRLEPEVDRIARDALAPGPGRRLREATARVVAEAHGHADDAIVTRLLRLYAKPLADRVHRHQTLQWAADLADARGWRLRVHGRGWESHPRFARYAAGELAHGDELRACYQSAAVHMHMTISNVVHQRIMECALSGGLPVCRLNAETAGLVRGALKIAASRGQIAATDDAGEIERAAFRVDGTADAAALASALREAGCDVPELLWMRADRIKQMRAKEVPPERRADWLLGDLASMTFTSPEGLERVVERALADPEWRRSASERMAARVRERLTDDAFVRRLLALVRDSLDDTP